MCEYATKAVKEETNWIYIFEWSKSRLHTSMNEVELPKMYFEVNKHSKMMNVDPLDSAWGYISRDVSNI